MGYYMNFVELSADFKAEKLGMVIKFGVADSYPVLLLLILFMAMKELAEGKYGK